MTENVPNYVVRRSGYMCMKCRKMIYFGKRFRERLQMHTEIEVRIDQTRMSAAFQSSAD